MPINIVTSEYTNVVQVKDDDSSSQISVEPPIDSQRLLVDNVAETCTDEMVRLYVILILNPSLNESFKLEEMRRNRRRVLLKFNQRIQFDEVLERQRKVPELCGKSIQFSQIRVPNTLRVTNLANTCTKEILNLYFSNAKVSRGGDLKSVRVFPHENKALVQFKNYNKLDDVLVQPHIICESVVKLEKYYEPIEDEFIRDEEELESQYFIEAESSVLNDKRKSMAVMTKSPLIQTTIDKTKLIISNIQENISIQQLDFYVQLITQRAADIAEVNWSMEHRGKLLVDFKREVDLAKIFADFEASYSSLNGKQIRLEMVNVTRTLVVLVKESKNNNAARAKTVAANLKQDSSTKNEEDYQPAFIPASRDLIELYFVNKQRSGGGEVESIVRKSSRYWLVTMKDLRSIKDILSREHQIDEKPVKVFPYYDNFGLPYLFKPVFDDESSMANFKLKIRDERLRYFCKVRTLHAKLNEILAESNAASKYNKNESNVLYVSYVEKLKTKVPYTERVWRLRVKESIEYFLQVYKYEKITLSFNQWSTISKTKQLGDSIVSGRTLGADEIDEDDVGGSSSRVRYVGSELAIIGINETQSNVELSIVGPNNEVDKFIVRIKDIICKTYFTFELEEKIIKFKTYLLECEELLGKWLNETGDSQDSDTEVLLAGRGADSDSLANATGAIKLNKSRRHTIDEFLSKLERDHLDMELSYGKLFQELGYTFLNQNETNSNNNNLDVDADSEYKDFNDSVSDMSTVIRIENEYESQMDKIKHTLDELRSRINEMRRKFRQYTIRAKRSAANNKNSSGNALGAGNITDASENEADDDAVTNFTDDNESGEDFFKLCVYVKEQAKILTFRVHRKCKVKELKQILFEKIADAKVNTFDDMILTFNQLELANDTYTISDYGITDKATVTLEFDEK